MSSSSGSGDSKKAKNLGGISSADPSKRNETSSNSKSTNSDYSVEFEKTKEFMKSQEMI